MLEVELAPFSAALADAVMLMALLLLLLCNLAGTTGWVCAMKAAILCCDAAWKTRAVKYVGTFPVCFSYLDLFCGKEIMLKEKIIISWGSDSLRMYTQQYIMHSMIGKHMACSQALGCNSHRLMPRITYVYTAEGKMWWPTCKKPRAKSLCNGQATKGKAFLQRAWNKGQREKLTATRPRLEFVGHAGQWAQGNTQQGWQWRLACAAAMIGGMLCAASWKNG